MKYLDRVLRNQLVARFLIVPGLALFLLMGAIPVSLAEGVADYPDTTTKADAEKKKDSKSDNKKKDGKDEEEEEETLEEAVKDLEKIEGLFTFYRGKEDGSLMMEVSEAQLSDGVEFIYTASHLTVLRMSGLTTFLVPMAVLPLSDFPAILIGSRFVS